MSKAGSRILSSVRAARASLQGGGGGGLAHVPDTVDVRAIRLEIGLSQDAFAKRFGLTVAAVRDWEQQRRQPEQAARVLLTVIAHEPAAVERSLAAVRI